MCWLRPRDDTSKTGLDSLAFYYDNTYSGKDQEGMAQFHQGGLMKIDLFVPFTRDGEGTPSHD